MSKLLNILSIVAFLIASVLFVHCGESSTDTRSDREEDQRDQRVEAFERERDQLLNDMRDLRDEMDKEISDFGTRIERSDDEFNESRENAYVELIDERSKLERSISDLENATVETWQGVKSGSRKVYSDISSQFTEWSRSHRDNRNN